MKASLFVFVLFSLFMQCFALRHDDASFTEVNPSRGDSIGFPGGLKVPPQELPARWLVIRSFVVFTEDSEMPPPHQHKSGSMDAHCAPASASACLRYPEPDRTDCLLLVARNLDRQVKRQQDNIAVLTGLLQERGRILGLHIHQFLIFLIPAFLFLVLLRCCTRKKTYKRIIVETEDAESPRSSETEKTVTSFSLSGETATAATYKLEIPASKIPPRVNIDTTPSSSTDYPGLAFPTAYYQH